MRPNSRLMLATAAPSRWRAWTYARADRSSAGSPSSWTRSAPAVLESSRPVYAMRRAIKPHPVFRKICAMASKSAGFVK